jgi:predicted nucleic acid-binding Zn ribbon protein
VIKLPPRAKVERRAAEAIVDALELRGLTTQIRAQRIGAEWTELVGAKIAQRTRPGDVREHVLYVEVATSAWMHELSLLKPQILASLLERLGEPKLFHDLRFQLASRDKRRVEAEVLARRLPKPRPAAIPATGAARDQILRETEGIDDAELRELIARVRIANDR